MFIGDRGFVLQGRQGLGNKSSYCLVFSATIEQSAKEQCALSLTIRFENRSAILWIFKNRKKSLCMGSFVEMFHVICENMGVRPIQE